MIRNERHSILFVGAGLVFCILFHFALLLDWVPFNPKYVLYFNFALVLVLWPVSSLANKMQTFKEIQRPFYTAWKIFPLWLSIGLGAIVVYTIVMFIYFHYMGEGIVDRSDMNKTLLKMNKSVSVGTMFFYAAVFGLLNLQWRVKQATEEDERVMD